MANTTTSSGLGDLDTIYFNKVAQDRLVKNFLLYHACDKKNVPKNAGFVHHFYRFDNVDGTTSTLTEDTLTAGQVQLSARTTSLTLSMYGQFMTISNFAQLTERTDFLKAGSEVLADGASDTVDLLVKAALDSNAASHVINQGTTAYLSASNSASLTASDKMDASVLRKVYRDLRANNVRPFADGKKYIGVFHPDVMFDLQSDDAVASWAQTAQYNQPEKITDAEMGCLSNIRLLESTQPTVASSVYESYVIGAHSLVAVSLTGNPIEILVKEPGSGGTSDPYSNIGTVAYKLPVFGVSWQGGGAGLSAGHGRAYRVLTQASV